jgi:hypothetical protein
MSSVSVASATTYGGKMAPYEPLGRTYLVAASPLIGTSSMFRVPVSGD